ncbi:unnamed protein product [Chondrus crispus]|uniref:Uncharacterized protein n=1 Tax=Chondrus crispus TaxID=2769 RepID=R7Q8F2_CHOCR|nr:unnamed protein product [Chondrus crispus]CDF33760.1 unnamed protein product [Chondrus crispus]|eukprot:XP_005713579.1 unnamed protein product [Chondrus crispus]
MQLKRQSTCTASIIGMRKRYHFVQESTMRSVTRM